MEKQTVPLDVPPELVEHPHWQLVQRIIASPALVRSHRLKSFLMYVTRSVLLDHSDHVSEQQIGIHVFERPADYNASEDNIVRSHARILRTKLAEYFASGPGMEEPVILTIPKGTYLPQFHSRAEAPPDATRVRRRWMPLAIVGAALGLTISNRTLGMSAMIATMRPRL